MKVFRLTRAFSDDALVLASNHKHVCKVQLNKPKALNSLCIPMIDLLQQYLYKWNNDPTLRLVLFSSGGKAFCAGGDVRSLYDAKKNSNSNAFSEFFSKEYILDYCLARMIPVQVCLYNGIVMGGGAGISINSPIRIATESSVFSMPETAIGLYPDVAGSYFLPRLPGNIGLYLAITAARLAGKELVQAGIATHFVGQEKIDELKTALIERVNPETSIQEIENIVNNFATVVQGPLSDNDEIDKYFGGANSVEEIFERLKDKREWSTAKEKSAEKLCPLSMKIAFEQLKRGKNLSLTQAYQMEYRLSLNFMQGEDFFEGFRAMLLDKDKNPKWQYKTLEEVSNDLVKSYFEPPSSNFEDLDVDKELEKLKKSR